MPSTNKFPSGLNNWSGTDKPKREDFVGDNQILDEDAMWKADYDLTGEVAAVGIVEYVSDYVSNQLSGISLDTSGLGEGFCDYTHIKSGNVHELEPVGNNGNIIMFIATADFNTGDSIVIDNVLLAAKTPDGEYLSEGSFKTNNIVICFRNGNTLTFIVNSVLLSGSQFTGDTYAQSQDSNTISLRNAQVQDAINNPVNTNWLLFRR